jgi:hypothetical protein
MGWLLINELERMRTNTAMAKFEVLYRHWFGGAEGKQGNSPASGPIFKTWTSQKEAVLLVT